MNPKLIVINRKTYNSVDEMPDDVRKQYEEATSTLKDDNKNHIPDIFESMNIPADKDRDGLPDLFENITSNVIISGSTKIIVDGKEFNGLEDLPPDIRARYEQAMGQLAANQNRIPDFLEGMVNTPRQTTHVETSFGTETPRRPKSSPALPDTARDLLSKSSIDCGLGQAFACQPDDSA
ncbi:MAG TPA: hypothetical protein VGA72_05415 [Anaerolineales bacterium]